MRRYLAALRGCLLLAAFALSASPVSAQLLAPAEVEEATAAADPFGRETPRTAVTGLIDALAATDYTRASQYLYSSDPEDPGRAEELAEQARQLQAVLDAGGTLLPFSALSNEVTGRLDDGLPPESERVGSFPGEEETPILLERGEGSEGSEIWRVAPETLDAIDAAMSDTEEIPATPIETGRMVGGAPLADWMLLLGIAAGSFVLLWIVSSAILALMRTLLADREKSTVYGLAHAALPPLSLFLAVVGFNLWAGNVEASIVARQTLLRYIGIVAWIALAWFALRLVDALAHLATNRMERQQRRQGASIVALMRRAAKVVLLAVAFVAIFDTFGFDVTAGFAALGIGGLALALGAQKTVENLVGSVTVIADKPVQVGDFCRVGGVVGTVEDIGMRSTRVRTLERTLVTIPNGDFSSREIENYAMRDRFLFDPTIGVEYGISAAKLREGVEIIERILSEHPLVEKEGLRARFAHFGASSLDIEIWSYITVLDYAESRAIRQELLLTIFERLEAAGLSIAFPTQKIHLVRDEEGEHA
ncbi:MAG: mechanosensitive ion channel family protein [Alphaproteobacteria bacterium]|nr:mechanosensitive ion channel family protein [Alphaproteobacteria bacterium]MBU2340675.1 mechanosensitive ion channel family protein [Alphaproteobacteria bacterium]